MFSRNNSATYIKANQSKVKDEERIGAETEKRTWHTFHSIKKNNNIRTHSHNISIFIFIYICI